MMRPDELQKKMDAVTALRYAAERLDKARTIASGDLYYNGHQTTKFTEDELNIVRDALVEHYRTNVIIKADQLRNSGVDPSSLLGPQVKP